MCTGRRERSPPHEWRSRSLLSVTIPTLWRHLEPDGRFYVLGLSAGGVRLYRASRYRMEAVPLEEGPTTLEEALQYDEHVRSVGFHTGTPQGSSGDSQRRPAMYYGQEDAGDKRYVKEGLLRFFRALDNQVRDVLGQDATPAPLVLAGVEGLRGLYRQGNQYPHQTLPAERVVSTSAHGAQSLLC